MCITLNKMLAETFWVVFMVDRIKKVKSINGSGLQVEALSKSSKHTLKWSAHGKNWSKTTIVQL